MGRVFYCIFIIALTGFTNANPVEELRLFPQVKEDNTRDGMIRSIFRFGNVIPGEEILYTEELPLTNSADHDFAPFHFIVPSGYEWTRMEFHLAQEGNIGSSFSIFSPSNRAVFSAQYTMRCDCPTFSYSLQVYGARRP